MTRTILSILYAVLTGIFATGSPLTAQARAREGSVVGRVASITEDRSSMTITPRDGGRPTVWPIADLPEARERAKAYRAGDLIAA